MVTVISFLSRYIGINNVDKVIDSYRFAFPVLFFFFFSFYSLIFIDWSIFFSLDVR